MQLDKRRYASFWSNGQQWSILHTPLPDSTILCTHQLVWKPKANSIYFPSSNKVKVTSVPILKVQ